MDFEKALAELTRDQAFRATVYAMNTLLIQKAIYTEEEWEYVSERRPAYLKARLL